MARAARDLLLLDMQRSGPCQLLDLLEQLFVRYELFARLQNAFETNDTLLVDDEVRTLREPAFRIENTIIRHRLQIRSVAQQWKIEFQEIGERLLRKRDVATDADDFGVGRGELAMVVPTGRQFFYSGRGEVEYVELDNDVLLARLLAQLELP